MTNEQLYLAIGVPILFNAVLFGLLWSHTNTRFDDFRVELSGIHEDIRELRSDLKLLTGKVYEMMGQKP